MSEYKNQKFASYICLPEELLVQYGDLTELLPSITDQGKKISVGKYTMYITEPEAGLHRWYTFSAGDWFIFLQGEFYSQPDFNFFREVIVDNKVNKDRLSEYISGLNGVFSGFLLNVDNDDTWMFTDRFGFGMQYLLRHKRRSVLSSSIWPLIAKEALRGEINAAAIRDIICLGFPLYGDTAYTNITNTRPGCLSLPNGSSYFYVTLKDKQHIPGKELLDKYRDAFRSHFDSIRGLANWDNYGLALSGGHDSRVVLQAMLDSNIHPECSTGFAGRISGDAKRARKVAEAKRCRFNLFDYGKVTDQEAIDTNILLDGAEAGHWSMSLARESKASDCIYFGTSGDFLSGGWRIEPEKFTSPVELAMAAYKADYEYSTPLPDFMRIFSKVTNDELFERYQATFRSEIDDFRDRFLQHRLDTRNYRRIRTFMHGSYLYGNPVHMFQDTRISDLYQSLPVEETVGQKLHVRLCSFPDSSLAWIPATNYYLPVPLEPYLLPVIKALFPEKLKKLLKMRSYRGRARQANVYNKNILEALQPYFDEIGIDSGRLERILEKDERSSLLELRLRYASSMLNPGEMMSKSTLFGKKQWLNELAR